MGIVAWIVLGLIAGLIAESLLGRRTGILTACVVGIVGALLGGFLARAVFHVHSLNSFFNLSTWVTAIVGSIVLVWLVGLAAAVPGADPAIGRHGVSRRGGWVYRAAQCRLSTEESRHG